MRDEREREKEKNHKRKNLLKSCTKLKKKVFENGELWFKSLSLPFTVMLIWSGQKKTKFDKIQT